MIFRLFRRDPQAATITALYGAIVAQARVPAFYLAFGVPDTPEGRFDLLVLHLALVCRRLGRAEGAEQAAARALSQGVFDMFCRDMDHNLREMGVGDLTVPKTMRKLGEAFYGRLEVYDRALGSADPPNCRGACPQHAGAGGAGRGGAAARRLCAGRGGSPRGAADRRLRRRQGELSRSDRGFPAGLRGPGMSAKNSCKDSCKDCCKNPVERSGSPRRRAGIRPASRSRRRRGDAHGGGGRRRRAGIAPPQRQVRCRPAGWRPQGHRARSRPPSSRPAWSPSSR